MKFSRRAALLALALGLMFLGGGDRPAWAKKRSAAASQETGKGMPVPPEGVSWGMSLEQLARLYDKIIADEMRPRLRKARPGAELDSLTEELNERQGALRRNHVDFGTVPTGIDQSALKGEYRYNNGESLSYVTLTSGSKRNFFFANGRLWKVYDEHKLAAGGPFGKNFLEAVRLVTERTGSPPKQSPADYARGRPFAEAEWHDADKILRAVDRGSVLGLVYSDPRVQDDLSHYAKSKTR